MSVKELIKKILPNFILEFYYNYKIKKKKYFGHHNLDKKLLKYLDYKDGSYVELGANDGVNQSNTYFFEKNLDWKGVLVEPIEKNFLKCKKNRSIKNFFSNKACVGFNYKSDKIKIIYSDLMSSLDDKNIVQDIDPVKHTNSGKIYLRSNETVKEYYVETTTLTNILEESNLSNKIDLLSLDVEGAEIEVLNGFDFKKYKFRYILIESRDDEKITKYLNDFNYKLLEKISKRDLFFKHNDF